MTDDQFPTCLRPILLSTAVLRDDTPALVAGRRPQPPDWWDIEPNYAYDGMMILLCSPLREYFIEPVYEWEPVEPEV